jgi:hypothetical protein
MPDPAHLLIVCCGAGYVVHAESRSLVGETGTDIMEVMRHNPAGLLFLNHGDMSFEAFGPGGSLWKTGRIGAGGFRNVGLEPGALTGETQNGSEPEWTAFSVDLGTGEVSWDDSTRGA